MTNTQSIKKNAGIYNCIKIQFTIANQNFCWGPISLVSTHSKVMEAKWVTRPQFDRGMQGQARICKFIWNKANHIVPSLLFCWRDFILVLMQEGMGQSSMFTSFKFPAFGFACNSWKTELSVLIRKFCGDNHIRVLSNIYKKIMMTDRYTH